MDAYLIRNVHIVNNTYLNPAN